jgi:acylpyruvate hydrolase
MKTVSIPATDNEYIVGKILCIGRNYVDHIKELGNEAPAAPIIFMKPSTAIISNGESVVIPAYSSDCHYEAELAVLIGAEGKDMPRLMHLPMWQAMVWQSI